VLHKISKQKIRISKVFNKSYLIKDQSVLLVIKTLKHN
jgi:hypothetical protein